MAEAKKTATPAEPETGTTEDGLPWKIVTVGGERYKLRAITVEESDTAYDASQNPDGTFNARLNSRMELAASIMEPATSVDDFSKWTIGKLVRLLRESERINALPAADAAGNG